MGGRGTYSTGQEPEQKYHAVGEIDGVKILEPIDGKQWRLPEENHSSTAYILLHPDGTFKRYREYNEDHTAKFDIDYHPEDKALGTGKRPILHIHEYHMKKGTLVREPARFMTEEEYTTYKRFFVNVPEGAYLP
ncbi:hypothetical protein PSRA_0098 [Pseudoscardovia radai]|uniref:Uncharacterized protein n=1 Tax=Pseudoscardovia radai TaxID=987066 RepID=A0A261F2G5_9BIFI|nr:hypothetical protein [Pseudoscardovia radai]OZG53291.1 hypothetical protein PSRA_0098 [Pseudoscardovia radai]